MGRAVFLPHRLLHYASIGSCVVALAVIFILSKQAVADRFQQWKLLPRPERFTELYFTDRHLPVKFKPGQKQQITFAVHNLEHQTTQYQYQIVVEATSKQQILDKGTVTLDQDQVQTISKTVAMPLKESRIAVRVNLTYDGIPRGEDSPRTETQSIHYWATAAN